MNITAINTIAQLGLASSNQAAILYLFASLLAVVGLVAPRLSGAIFLIPQQLLLTLSAYGAVQAMLSGTFADGVIRSKAFLVADQAPSVILLFLYGLSVYANYFVMEGNRD